MNDRQSVPPTWIEEKSVIRDAEGNIVKTISRFVPPEEPHGLAVVARFPNGYVVRRLPNGDEMIVKEPTAIETEPGRPYAPRHEKNYVT